MSGAVQGAGDTSENKQIKNPALVAHRMCAKTDVTQLITQLTITVNDLNTDRCRRPEAGRRAASDFLATG